MPYFELPATGLDEVESDLPRAACLVNFSPRVFTELKRFFLPSLLVVLPSTLLVLLVLFEELDSLGLLRN